MRKLIMILVMLLVASGVNAQSTVEDLFERIENVEYRKAAEREREQRLKSERFKEKIQMEACEKFANKLRLDGVDITKLTDEDIERLDSIRIQHRKADPYYISLLDENEVLYNLPSRIFKYVMLKEMRYYAKIKSEKQEYYCNADSTVFVEPGLYQYCYDNKFGTTSKTLTYDGDRITIGRATFICKNKVIKNKVKKSKKKVADAEDDIYYLGKYDSSEGYHYRNSYSDYSARANFFSSMFRLTGNAGWLLNF